MKHTRSVTYIYARSSLANEAASVCASVTAVMDLIQKNQTEKERIQLELENHAF